MFAIHAVIAAWSLWPTKEQRVAHQTKVAEKKAEKEKWAALEKSDEWTAEQQWQHMWELQQLPRTPGTAGGMKSPVTPTTRAFHALSGEQSGGYYGAPQTPVSPMFYEGKGKEPYR